jgi:hypothetical protein
VARAALIFRLKFRMHFSSRHSCYKTAHLIALLSFQPLDSVLMPADQSVLLSVCETKFYTHLKQKVKVSFYIFQFFICRQERPEERADVVKGCNLVLITR